MAIRYLKDIPNWRRVDKVPQMHEKRMYHGPKQYIELDEFIDGLRREVVGIIDPHIEITADHDDYYGTTINVELYGWVVKTEDDLKEARREMKEREIEAANRWKANDERLLAQIRERSPELFDE